MGAEESERPESATAQKHPEQQERAANIEKAAIASDLKKKKKRRAHRMTIRRSHTNG